MRAASPKTEANFRNLLVEADKIADVRVIVDRRLKTQAARQAKAG